MIVDDKHVITGDAVVLWDGVTQPEDDKHNPGKKVHSLKIAIAPNSPEINEITQLATNALNSDSTFKGVLPNGGIWPIGAAGVDEFDPSVNGFVLINAKTRKGTRPLLIRTTLFWTRCSMEICYTLALSCKFSCILTRLTTFQRA